MTHEVALLSKSVAETQMIASALAVQCAAGDCIILSGDLGAGKTHFAQGFARGLGVERAVASPTFNLVLRYEEARLPLNHFDLYRLEQPKELEDIDFYGLVESEDISLVEWGEKFDEVMEEAVLHITITIREDETRAIIMRSLNDRGEELLEATKSLLETF